MRQFAEKQHTQINCITFGSLQVGHASPNPADSRFCQPMRTFGEHISITVTTYIYVKKIVS